MISECDFRVWAIQHSIVLSYIVMCYTALYWATLSVMGPNVLYQAKLLCIGYTEVYLDVLTVMGCTVMYWDALYYIGLYCNLFGCTSLY